jgi:minor extracellular serine protease Vpr
MIRMNFMGRRQFSIRLKYLLPILALIVGIIGTGGVSFSTQQPLQRRADDSRLLRRMMIPGTEDLQLIVELSDPALLERMQRSISSRQNREIQALSERGRRMNFASAEAIAHRQDIGRTQESMKQRIAVLPGALVLGTTDTLMNAVLVRIPAAQYRSIRQLAGVKKVYFSRPKRMLLDQAAAISNAQGLWTMAGGQSKAGQGIKIGIIDSGIDISNPMFSGTGMSAPSGFPRYDTTADRALTNSKVIVARNYISLLSNPSQRVQTAVDEVGHGTFVAGCAAGAQVSAPLASISGMAPGAYLGNYKIFGTPGINDSTTSAAEIAAIDQAVADGMDVINLSIGSLDYLPPEEDAEYQTLTRAVQAGVVVTVAAGNEGPNTHTISSPAAIPDVIAVGSISNARQFLAVIRTTNPGQSTIGYLPSDDGIQVSSDLPLTKVVDVASLDGDGLGCSAFASGSLLNAVAFVKRGTCLFSDKVNNASRAGATSVVVYNNKDGLEPMSGLSLATIPAVMISMADGIALKQYINSNPGQAQVGIGSASVLNSVATPARVISSFSSVGPGTDFSIKPDLVAVGENVYSAATTRPSATMYDPTGFRVSDGTSFSAPMVAGAAAGLMQRFPSLGSLAIKSLLTTTASRNLTIAGGSSAGVLEAGSGLLDMGNAMSAGAVFSPANLNFGVHSYGGTLALSASLTIQNISSNSDQFTLGVEPIVSGPVISFSADSTGNVAAGSSTSIDVHLQIAAPATGGFQGFVTVRSAATSLVYRIPYWAGLYVPDSTRVLQVTQSASGRGSFSNLTDAIAAAQPGNVIEIQDNSTYSAGDAGITISTNGQGLPLHGLTIRAAAGKIPVIQTSALTTVIRVIGLKDVLLQGLQIQGGYTGVQLWQPSTAVPLTVTIDRCTIFGSTGDGGAAGVWIDGGGTIEITRSNIGGSSGAGLVAGLYASGTQLTVVGSGFQTNGFDGLNAYMADVHVLNSTFSGNSGVGAYLDSCTGTVAGSTFSQNLRPSNSYGDGLQIADGNVTIKDNLFDLNGDAGIALFSGSTTGGPKAQIVGNKIHGNGDYGIFSSPALQVTADGNLIDDNAGGAYLDATASALFMNNILVRSTSSLIGDGVKIEGTTNVRLVNNTIYQNALRGVLLNSGTVFVGNSIVSSNTGGNLQGVNSASTESLFTSADPKFVNPDTNDFSLRPDSPAIDAGSGAVLDLPFLDYNSHVRVASLTDLPGQGKVDIGAVEANSAYPLVYPLILNGSESTVGGSFTTGVAFINPGTTTAQFQFTAYNGAGSKLAGTQNPYTLKLVPDGQLAILDYQMFGFGSTDSARGGVLGFSDSSTAGFTLFVDPGFRKFATGANASTRLTNELVFMRHQSGSGRTTSYVIFNPGINSANITATLHNPGGSAVAQQTATLAAKGHTVLQFNAGTSTGYVAVRSDRPVTGVELVGNQNVVAALGGFTPDTQARLFFPHYAVGGNYSTQVGIVNTNASLAVTLTLYAYNDNGYLIGTLESVALQPGEQLLKTITELFGISSDGPLQTGYLIAQSDQAGIMGFTDFSYSDGVAASDATIPADSAPSRRLLFSHIANGVPAGSGVPYLTGIALLNPFGTAVKYTMSVYDGEGTLKAQATQTIGPRQKVAKILSYPAEGVGFFTQDLALANGHIEVTTDYGLMGLELFFTEDVSQLASVPAQTGD